jgi:thiol:disulfide interchange protein DsbC
MPMLFHSPSRRACAFLTAGLLMAGATQANEAAIRKNLAERMPNIPKIDEIQKTPVAGLWEVRIGTDILYTDAEGQYIIQGDVFDTKARQNLTQTRIDKLTAFDFPTLPLKDAIAFKQGSGARKLVVFGDPNCGYCKRFERDVASLKDVTVYTFLYPILGPDSDAKSRDIWCAKDRGKAWRDWMLEGKTPPKAEANCDVAAITRNVALGKKHRVQGTPAAVLEDGARLPGAVPLEQLERRVAAASKG